ncbi:MAG: hypothetical protein RIQ60_2864 [Pseudomonadota bacterium]|jgi:signal transduction histidine kinase/ActR/RegA family two-component response regulator/HPt (histidine-containing phosphotransfer) domain-containing protein
MAPAFELDQLPVGLLMLDAQHSVLRVNHHAAELIGSPAAELQGRRFDQLLTPASRLLYHSHVVPLLQLRQRVDEIELTLLSGAQRQAALFNAVLRRPPDGAEPRIHAALVRLGERRRLEDQLRNAQRAAEQLPGVLFQLLLSAQGQWSMPYASEGLRRLHGLAPELVREQLGPWWNSLHPQDRDVVEAGLRASASQMQDWRARYRCIAGRREVWVESRASLQRLADGSFLWHGYSEDITEHRLLETALQDQRAAETANRAKSDFLATMSHEIRTPVHIMLGMAQLMRRELAGAHDSPQTQRLHQINEAGRHLLSVVNNVLDITRIESGRLELEAIDFDLAELCTQAHGLLDESARAKGLSLTVDLGDTRSAWCGDPTRLRQSLLNLVSNALKFTRQGGVQIVVRELPAATDAPTDAPCTLRFEVIDSGPGMDEAALARLFQPFVQAGSDVARQHGGSGLGLVITRRLARLMHGDAGATSTLGVGSRFWFTARLAPSTASPTATSGEALEARVRARAATLGGRRVLVADDHPVNRELTTDLLTVVQLQADQACDGQEALDKVMQADPPYALVLMDMHMPVMDGLTATAAIRRQPGQAGLPIVAMTASAFAADRAACLAAGMNDYITKPMELDQLHSMLLRWLPTEAQGTDAGGRTAGQTPVQSPGSPQPGSPVQPSAAARPAQAPGVGTAPAVTSNPRASTATPGGTRPAAAAAPAAPTSAIDQHEELAWRTRLLSVPGLDAARGLYQVRDRLPAYLRVLGVFAQSLHKGRGELQDWLATHDAADSASEGADLRAAQPLAELNTSADVLNALVHRIKGSAAAVGAMGLHGHAVRAESLIRSGSPLAELQPAIVSLALEAGQLAQALDTLLAN